MPPDPLSDVLSLLRPRSSLSAGLDAGGDWAVRFEAPDGIKFNAVVRGTCWVKVEGETEPKRVDQGDCYLLTRRRAYVLASDPALEPADATPLCAAAENNIGILNGGGDFFLIGGRFDFAGEHAELLFDSLPALVHVRGASDQASVLRWALDQLASELADSQPGSFLISDHLAHIMLVQVLRLWLETGHNGQAGWLHALGDPRIGPVLAAIHADPARRWTLPELAALAGMSRSSFALRFRQAAGLPPLAYLTRWRMLVAGDRLRTSGETISSIALSLGYESESAFSTAFKRALECSPREWRRQLPLQRA
jgi:AraC-like DNA-binding protein